MRLKVHFPQVEPNTYEMPATVHSAEGERIAGMA